MRQRKRENRRHEISPVSFDVPWNLAMDVPDEAVGLRVERLRHCMESNAAGLSALERRVLDERFPANDSPARTFKQIARAIGLSKERVRQIQIIALDKLKQALEEDKYLQ
jgi:DNA-directed RNA polymerase sigma subunit (sigma70/sigma32)